MKYIKKFIRFIKESTALAQTPESDTKTKPKVPTKPKQPTKPKEPIIKEPKKDPQRKSVTEMDVVNRFIEEMHKQGKSIEKYM